MGGGGGERRFSAQTVDGKTAGRANQSRRCREGGQCAGEWCRDPSGSRRLVSSMCRRQATVEGAGGIGFSQALLPAPDFGDFVLNVYSSQNFSQYGHQLAVPT